MSNDLPAVPEASVFGLMRQDLTQAERAKLQVQAMEKVQDDRFDNPVPRFLTELPFGGDNDEITDRMAARLLLSDDPDAAQNEAGTIAGKELVGRTVVVWDIRVMPGDKPGGWGAYLLLDVTEGDSDDHIVVNTGAKQAVVRLARAWSDGDLPIRGAFATIGGTGRRGEPAVTFISEAPF